MLVVSFADTSQPTFRKNMDDLDPVTHWMNHLREGDERAARQLWVHFVDRLQTSLKQKLQPNTRRVYDEEDAAQSAFFSLCRGITAGRYPDLTDRRSLWNLLLTIAARKVNHRHRFDHQKKRDIARTEEMTIVLSGGDLSTLERPLPSAEPTPEYLAEFHETWCALFESLEDKTLEEVSRMKIEGYSDAEIGDKLGLTDRTIRRKVERIRRIWKETLPDVVPT